MQTNQIFLLLFRAVKHPLQQSLSTLWRVTSVAMVYLLSIATSTPLIYYTSYSRGTNGNTCTLWLPNMLHYAIALGVVASFLPLTIIIFIQILSWTTLQQSMRKLKILKNQRRSDRLKKASRTYLSIVVVFFILTLPKGIYYICFMYWYENNIPIIYRNKIVWQLLDITQLLLVFHSCVNPLIYAKLYRQICTGRPRSKVNGKPNIQLSHAQRKTARTHASSVTTMNTRI